MVVVALVALGALVAAVTPMAVSAPVADGAPVQCSAVVAVRLAGRRRHGGPWRAPPASGAPGVPGDARHERLRLAVQLGGSPRRLALGTHISPSSDCAGSHGWRVSHALVGALSLGTVGPSLATHGSLSSG